MSARQDELDQVTGDPWGARPGVWSEMEEMSRPLFESILDETGVGKGTRLLDVGCGSGLACQIAAARRARVCGLDASPGLLEVARGRVPKGEFRVGRSDVLPLR